MSTITFKPLAKEDTKLIFANREFSVTRMTAGITKKEFDSFTFKEQKEMVKRWMQEEKEGKGCTFLILQGGEYMGKCALHSISKQNNSASVSLGIKEKYRGQGYGTQAVKFLEKMAFSKLKLNRLEYGCYSNNEPSRKLAEKCGFTYEGTLRQAKKVGTKYHDRWIFSKLKSDYKKT